MKMSIITLHCVKNYGSVLQTYATQEYFKNMGLEVEVIDFRRDDLQDPYFYVNKGVKKIGSGNKKKIKKFIYKSISKKVADRKIKVFGGFLDRYINISEKVYLSEKDISDNPPSADIYCVGSDQMWNKECNHGIVRPFFLTFAPEDKKRMSFASSFGRKSLDEDEIVVTRKMLQKFDAISVREDSGLKILQDLGIENGVHILDPTLCLTGKEWSKLCERKLAPRKPYLLIYELGSNSLLKDCAKKIAKEKGLKIIRIGIGFSQVIKGHTTLFPEVDKWLSLFKYADYIITDSFHGTAFSINFNKQFHVVYPRNFSTRLQSALGLFKLENRVAKNTGAFKISNTPINYEVVNAILAQERNKSKEFAKKAINMGESASEKKH